MSLPALDPTCRGIYLVDDHPCMLDGVQLVIERRTRHRIVGTATTGNEAMSGILATDPDLVIMDLTLPDRSGLELIKDLKAQRPGMLFLVLSMNDELLYAERVLRAGGHGYIMKETVSDVLAEAIGKVFSEKMYLSGRAASHILGRISGAPGRQPKSRLESLTDRQLEIFGLIGKGKDNGEIAELLHLSPRTVEAHKAELRKRLGIPDTNTLVHHAVYWATSGELPG